MSSNANNSIGISFRSAAGIAIIAVAADLYFNRGEIVSALTSGVLRNVARLFNTSVDKPPETNVQENGPKYRAIKHQGYEFPRDGGALEKALEKVQRNFPGEYHKLLMKKELSSKESILSFFKDALSKGICSGVANALFDKIHRKESHSLKESVPLLNFEDIFYHQILQDLCVKRAGLDFITQSELLTKKLEYNEEILHKALEHLSSNLPPPLIEKKSDEEWNAAEKQIRDEFEKALIHVGKEYHTSAFPESDKFLVLANIETYREFLAQVTHQFPGEEDFVGCVHIQNHVIGFQYGKSGYYVYDPIDTEKGLFEYPDSQTFLQGLKGHALDDVIYVKGVIVAQQGNSTDSPGAFKANVDELVNKAKAYFGARTLNSINDQ